MDKKTGLEDSLKELGKIVQNLEDKNITLDDAIAEFEKGIRLTSECLNSISSGKGKIALLEQEMDALLEKPFEED